MPKNLLEAKKFTQKIIFRALKYPQKLTHPTPLNLQRTPR